MIKRIRGLTTYFKRVTKGPVSYTNTYSLLFICYPLLYLGFYASVDFFTKDFILVTQLLFFCRLIWVLTFILTLLSHLLKNRVILGVGVYILGVVSLFMIPIALNIDGILGVNAIKFQWFSFLIWPMIIYSLQLLLYVDGEGQVKVTDNLLNKFYYVIGAPMIFIGMPCILLTSLGVENLMPWLAWSLALTCCPALINGWFIVVYPITKKRDSLGQSDNYQSNISLLAPIANRVTNQIIDINRFRKDNNHD